jgi:hypothetical protein
MPASLKSPEKAGISVVCCETEKDLLRYPIDALALDIIGEEVPRTFPVYLFFYHGELRGWANVRRQLVVYPCIHPDKIPPRQFIKLTRSLVTEFKRFAGDPIFMLCDYARRLGPKHMRRLRLKPAEEMAYLYTEEDGL